MLFVGRRHSRTSGRTTSSGSSTPTRRCTTAKARLILAGSYGGFETYLAAAARARRRARRATTCTSSARSRNEELTALYDVADLFLCASEHEGFCVPLIEAFYKRVPVRGATRPRPCPRRWTAAACSTRRAIRGRSRRSMHGVVSDARARGRGARARRTPRSSGCWRRTSTARCCGFVRAGPRRRRAGRAAPVAPDFWRQFTLAEELEAIRQTRPAAFRALPLGPDAGRGRRPGAPRDDRQPVGAGGASRRRRRRQRARACATCSARWGHDVRHLRADHRRRPARTRSGRGRDPAARDGDVTILHFAVPSPMTRGARARCRARACSATTTSRRAHFFAPFDAGTRAA